MDYGRIEWQYPEDAETPLYHSSAVTTEAKAVELRESLLAGGCVNITVTPNR